MNKRPRVRSRRGRRYRRPKRSKLIIPILIVALLTFAAAVAFVQYIQKPPSPAHAKFETKIKKAARVLPNLLPQKFPQPPPPKKLTVIAVGDILFDRQVASFIAKEGSGAPFAYVSPILQSGDIAFANLECPLSNKGSRLKEKDVTFRGTPQATVGIRQSGIDVVSLANNHALDYGPQALADTISLLNRSGIKSAGAGQNISQAHQPAILKVRNKQVSLLAYSYVIPAGFFASPSHPGIASARSPDRVAQQVKEAKKTSDFVILSFHWGVEYQDYPISIQRQLAHTAIDSGADLVLGHHPHVIQGLEIYKNKLIAYSLGDFVFDHFSRKTGEAFILKCEMSQEKVLSATCIPVYLTSYGQPRVVKGKEAKTILSRLATISSPFQTRLILQNNVATVQIR